MRKPGRLPKGLLEPCSASAETPRRLTSMYSTVQSNKPARSSRREEIQLEYQRASQSKRLTWHPEKEVRILNYSKTRCAVLNPLLLDFEIATRPKELRAAYNSTRYLFIRSTSTCRKVVSSYSIPPQSRRSRLLGFAPFERFWGITRALWWKRSSSDLMFVQVTAETAS